MGKTLELDVKIDGKLDPSAKAAFDKLSNMANKTVGKAKMQEISKGINSVHAAASKVLKVAATSAVAIGAALAAIGGRGAQLASDLAEVQNVVDVTFGQNAKTVNTWSKTVLESYGLSELSAKRYSSTMGAMLKSSGLADDKILEMSTNLTQLTGDMASFYNLNAADMFEKIQSGISGEIKPLRDLGINMSVANLEAFALSQGITKSYDAMLQSEKATLRYNYLLSVSKDSQGDFTRTQSSFANQVKLSKEKIDQLTISIGQKLLPKLAPVIQKFNDFIGSIPPGTLEQIGKTISDIALGGIDIITKSVKFLYPIVKGIISFVTKHGTLVKGLILGIAVAFGVLTAAQIAFNIAAWANPVGLIILGIMAAIALVTLAIYAFAKNWDNIVKWLGDVWNGFAGGLKSVWNSVVSFLSGAWSGFVSGLKIAWDAIWGGIISGFKTFVNIFISGVNTIIGGLNKLQFTAPDWAPLGLAGKTVGINIPLIPYLAKGATVTAATLAMIGEAGTETVVPHNNRPRSRMLALEAARGTGLNIGGNTIQITFSPIIYGANGNIEKQLEDAGDDFERRMDRYFANKGRLSYEGV